jgi:hypothetical protein
LLVGLAGFVLLGGQNLWADSVSGSFSSPHQVWAYTLEIYDPSTFSATLVNGGTPTSLDAMMFLFSTSGVGLIANDDTTSSDRRPTLPVGSAASFAPGEYWLLLSVYENVPFDSSNNLIFPGLHNTGVFAASGSAGGLDHFGPVNDYGYGYGPFQLDVTGAGEVQGNALPEPSTLTMLAIGLFGAVGASRRKKILAV